MSHGIQSLIRFHISKDKGEDIIKAANKNYYEIARIRNINNELFDLKESLLELSDELEIWKELVSEITHESFIDYTTEYAIEIINSLSSSIDDANMELEEFRELVSTTKSDKNNDENA